MKKIFAILAAVSFVAFASCSPETKPDDGGKTPEVNAPVADFSFSVDGLTVTFTDKSTDAVNYKWEFGDDETSKEKNPVHEYANGGEYTVTLTVSNAAGSNKKSQTLTVSGGVQAYFSYTVLDGRAGAFGKKVKFDATSSTGATSIAWDFGDGETSTDFVVEHTFPEYQSYTVKATVSGEGGASNTYEASIALVEKNELLVGGSMEEGDAAAWTYVSGNNPDWFGEDQFPGQPSFSFSFGYTEDKPANGVGGCFRADASKQLAQADFNFTLYQAVELVKDDEVVLGLDLKWAEESNNDGLFWIGLCNNEEALIAREQESKAPVNYAVEMFNYWGAAPTGDWGDGGASVPAYDGGLEGTAEWIDANVSMELGYSGAESVKWTVPETGTYYFYIQYRNVWGNYWGKDILLDNASLKIIL